MQNKSNEDAGSPKQRVKRRSRKAQTVRFNLCMSPQLLELVDQAADQEYTTRSDIIRTALLWYLRPQGRELDQADPDAILEVLKRRKLKAGIKSLLDANKTALD